MGSTISKGAVRYVVPAAAAMYKSHKIGKTFETLEATIPRVQVAGLSFLAKAEIFLRFSKYLAGASIVAHFAQTAQGIKALKDIGLKLEEIRDELAALTTLQAQEKFAKQVYKYIRQRTTEEAQTNSARTPMHCFFVYHPDTDWHPDFWALVERRPLPNNFCGMSENLDALCVWMQFVRALLVSQTKGGKKVNFHLLIPAYRPLVVREPLRFPEELHPLTVEGHIHNSGPMVWLNIPDAECGLLHHVANLARPPSEWGGLATAGAAVGTFAGGAAGTMAATAVAATVAAPLAIPIFFLGGLATMTSTVYVVEEVDKRFREMPPRILGQDRRTGNDQGPRR